MPPLPPTETLTWLARALRTQLANDNIEEAIQLLEDNGAKIKHAPAVTRSTSAAEAAQKGQAQAERKI